MRRWIVVGLLAALVASQVWGPPACRVFASRGVGCGVLVIELRGRLVDSVSGAPLSGRGVSAFQYESEVREPGAGEAFAKRTSAARAAMAEGSLRKPHPVQEMYMEAHGLTDADGRFQVQLYQWHCTEIVGGEPQGPTEPPPRSGLYALMVERQGSEPPALLTQLPTGSWDRAPDPVQAFDRWATWDLGDVRVPRAK